MYLRWVCVLNTEGLFQEYLEINTTFLFMSTRCVCLEHLSPFQEYLEIDMCFSHLRHFQEYLVMGAFALLDTKR